MPLRRKGELAPSGLIINAGDGRPAREGGHAMARHASALVHPDVWGCCFCRRCCFCYCYYSCYCCCGAV